MSSFGIYNLCCNPLQIENHRVRRGLRRASIPQQNSYNLKLESVSQELTSQTSSLSQLSLGTVLPVVNDAIALLNQSPIVKKYADNQTYLQKKVRNVCDELNTSLGILKDTDDETNSKDFLEMIEKLKIKFTNNNTTRSEKIQILTLLPETWGLPRVCSIMGCTRYMASLARRLREEKGILSTPNAKLGRSLSNDIKARIREFYVDDEISVNMPGMKDYLSIRNDDGKREHMQKRLILSNLRELYEIFKERYPDHRIGFSKFASLRPQHCVLAGSSGTHTICVCSMHQNIKLMMLGCNLATLTSQSETSLQHYGDCLEIIMCQESTSDCYFNNCDKCPGVQILKNLLLDILDENGIDEVTYKYWISKPRTSMETFVKSSTDFVDNFCENLLALLPHHYIAKKQASYLRSLKESLKQNEYIVICDFSENYAFVIQNAASGFHWNNDQATIYPVVIYYKEDNVLIHKSLVIISDCLSHDAVAVHEFIRITTEFIKELSNDAVKIIYFSDGAPQQFKNFKNFVNINYHKEDFGLEVEWHFFATAHGKGPCDGVGGTVKRIASRASLQLPYNEQISTPHQLYDWAVKPNSLPNICIRFFSNDDYIQAKEFLEKRYLKAKTISGTQKYHCVIPDGEGTLKFKEFSFSSNSQTYKLFKRVRKCE
ncbi:uncharacterized protein [Venturia canescens]|uniref:uncharacterized protein isoform X2 n=1 Tax=Venturia canescens TaxID=32260 RepID=UPI001C9D2322|nr:uncharacterized protein LOC122412912 isoform X2 [Venturia canescens]